MDARQEIIDYIEMNETPGALLLTGEWGCGKTYLIKEIAEKYKAQKNDDHVQSEKMIVIVSMFGVASVSELQEKVKRAVFHSSINISEVAGKWTKKISDTIKGFLPGNWGSLLSVNFYDVLEVSSLVGKKTLVLVLDDFERCSCTDRIALLGCINDYVENKRIKVILVADEKKIERLSDDTKYHDYKEKVIGRTINLSPDFDAIINNLINQYKETTTGYSAFLSKNRDVLYRVFSESNSKNIRLMKYIMFDFERIYAAWKKSGITEKDMPFALYTFAADYFWSRLPKDTEDKDDKSGYHDKRAEKYPLRGEKNSIFFSIGNWIDSGNWDENEFITELKNHYGVINLSPEQGFLLAPFWEMEQKYIDEGLPVAIDKAYHGELTHDELTSLIQKIWGLRKNKIPLPCDVEYDKILRGYQTRLNRIKSGDIISGRNHSFAMLEQIEEDAKPINILLEKERDLVAIYNNRRRLLDCAHDPRGYNWYRFERNIFEELDDEMLNAIWEAYSRGDNQIKREIGIALSKIRFIWDAVTDISNLKTTRTSYNKLIGLIDEAILNCDEAITKLILQTTLSNVQERAKEIDEEINKFTETTEVE